MDGLAINGGENIEIRDFMTEYEILQELGVGSSGTVYLVRRRNLNKSMVMKKMRKTSESKQQYQYEIQVLMNLSIPGVPELYDYGEDENYFYIIEEFISGESLHSILMQSISQEQLIQYSKQIAMILYELHGQEVLYLDMKPEHIKIEQGMVFLLDYGLARFVHEGCVKGVTHGTIPYASLEQCERHYATKLSDIYSLGMVFREMLRSQGDNCDKEVKDAFEILVERMTREKDEERISSIKEVVSVLSSMEKKKKDSYNSHSNIKIAVVGSEHRVGTTFISAYLTSCLNASHLDACYRESIDNRWILGSVLDHSKKPNFMPRMKGKLKLLPNCGPFVKEHDGEKYRGGKREANIEIYDLGVIQEKMDFQEYDHVFMVLGARPWEHRRSLEMIALLPKEKDAMFLCSMVTRYDAARLAEMLGKGVYRIGVIENIYAPRKREVQLMVNMIKRGLQNSKERRS